MLRGAGGDGETASAESANRGARAVASRERSAADVTGRVTQHITV
jgi:hypothetical protein